MPSPLQWLLQFGAQLPGKFVRSLDVLVIGGGQSALVTAALLGRRGYRGLLVSQGELSPHTCQREDWTWNDAQSPILAHVHEELGLQTAFRIKSGPLKPGLRIVDTHHRIELESKESPERALRYLTGLSSEELTQNLDRIKEAHLELSSFLQPSLKFPASGFFERRRVDAALMRMSLCTEVSNPSLNPSLLRLGHSLTPFLTHGVHTERAPTLGQMARLLYFVLDGPQLPEYGRPCRELLLDRAHRSGFPLHDGRVSSITRDGRHFRVLLDHRRAPDRVQAIVDASEHLSGVQIMAQTEFKRLEPIAADPSAGYIWSIRWQIDKKWVPDQIGCSVLIMATPDSPSIWLSAHNLSPNEVLLNAEFFVPHTSSSEPVALMAPKVIAHVQKVVPFLAHHTQQSPPTQHHRVHLIDKSDPTGLGKWTVRTPHKYLFLAGPAVLPGCLSSEGAYSSALQTVDAITRVLGERR